MALPGNPPATTTPAAFKAWAQNVADTADDHEGRIVDLEGGSNISDTAYDETTWNGVTDEAPSKNAVRDKIEAILAGATFTGDVSVPDDAYGAGWNGSAEVPTKNAVYDKIETLGGGGGGGGPTFYSTKGSGAGSYSTTSTTATNVDGTNLAVNDIDCAVGDRLEIRITCAAYNSGSNYTRIDALVDQPTSADVLAAGNLGASNGIINHFGTGASYAEAGSIVFTVTEAGLHDVRLQWWVTSGTGYMFNGTANEDTLPVFTVTHWPA